jgi:hypothetical protein
LYRKYSILAVAFDTYETLPFKARLLCGSKETLDECGELPVGLQIVWLLKIRFCAQALNGSAIRLRSRGGDHNNGSVIARGAMPKLPQHFDPRNLRQVQIQKYKRRAVIASGVLQISQCVLSIGGSAEAEVEPALLNHFPNHKDVRRVILDEQYRTGFGIG